MTSPTDREFEMNQFIETKLVNAIPMTRAEYNTFRGWELPANENGADEGFLVEYLDGGAPNTHEYAGYVSWSPKEQFEGAYRQTSGMTFGLALEAMQQGKRVSRTGWNGVGLWLEHIPANGVDLAFIRMSYPVNSKAYPEGARVPWLASQTDMLATDWQVV